MKMPIALFYAFSVTALLAQLPPSGVLTATDRPLFQAEIDKVARDLANSPGNCWAMNEMARTWAAGQQYPETIEWLKRLSGTGIDPSRDPLYKPLRNTREFQDLLSNIVPVSHGNVAFRIAEGDLTPESEAYDPASHKFYFGSMRKGKIVRCDASGRCSQWAKGLGVVLGVKVARGTLWAIANSDLVAFDLRSARLLHRYPGHRLNDIAVARSGDVYTTDTQGGSLRKLRQGGNTLEAFLPAVKFRFANGIAISDDGAKLYVSNYPNGIDVVDLATNFVRPLAHGPELCLAQVDGLYFHDRTLIAIQNGAMAWRVIRIRLTTNLQEAESWAVLERANPLFEGITGGTIVGNEFFFVANIQNEKHDHFTPLMILRVPI